jgi:hypothetical protein
MKRLNRFVKKCRKSEHQAAAAMIRDGEQTRALLQLMINSFNQLKACSPTLDFNSCKTFDHVCSMYKSRLDSERYHVLVERCPQEQINCVADVFNEYDIKYYYLNCSQISILGSLETHLLPHLTKTSQENRAIAIQILSDFDRLRKTQQLDDVYAAERLFRQVCSNYQK